MAEKKFDYRYAQEDYVLRWAAENGYLDIVKYLVKHGADIHANSDYALRLAIDSEHLNVIKYLADQGVE